MSGTISKDSTWRLAGSPYTLTGNVTVSGAKLTIENGVVVNTGYNDINLNSINGKPAHLAASGVTFKSTANLSSSINFDGYVSGASVYPSTGQITGCTFENLYIYCTDNSQPSISNSSFQYANGNGTAIQLTNGATPSLTGNTFRGYQYALSMINEAKPVFASNDNSGCTSRTIAINGTFNNDYQLPSYGLEYTLTSNLTVNGSTFSIPSGITIHTGTYDISIIATSTKPARLQASGVSFRSTASLSSSLTFDAYLSGAVVIPSTGQLSGCTFDNLVIISTDRSSPVIQNCTIRNSGSSGTAIQVNLEATPTITGNTISGFLYPLSITNDSKPAFSGNDISGCINKGIAISGTFSKDYQLVDFGYPYGMTGNLYISGSAFTIPTGITLYTFTNDISVSSTNGKPASLTATGVTFKSSGSLSTTINFDGYVSGSLIYPAGGTLTGCTFENIGFNFVDNAAPTVSNSTVSYSGNSGIAFNATNGTTPTLSGNVISGFQYPLAIGAGALPQFTGNNTSGCTTQLIALSGSFSTDYTLPDFGLSYALTGTLTISGATFTIPRGKSINLNSYSINVNSYNSGINSRQARLNADGVTLKSTASYSPTVNFTGYVYNSVQYPAGGLLTGCLIENITIRCYANSTPTITRSKLFHSKLALYTATGSAPIITQNDFYHNETAIQQAGTQTLEFPNNFWGHQSGPTHPSVPGGQGEDCTGNAYFLPFSKTPINGTIDPETTESELTFFPLPVGSYAEKTIHVTNKGDIDLKISSITSSSSSYKAMGTFPVWIHKGETIPFTIRFAPVKPGDFNDKLKIATNQLSKDTIHIPVKGQGTKVLKMNPIALNFGRLYIRTAKTLNFSIKNEGTTTLTIDSMIAPNTAFQFERSQSYILKSLKLDENEWNENTTPIIPEVKMASMAIPVFSIKPGDSAVITMTFKPLVHKKYGGDIRIHYNSVGIDYLPINGEGYADPLQVTIQSIDFKNFPDIYLNAKVDTFGKGIESLDQRNFRIIEDNAQQNTLFKVIPPGQSGGARIADIVFVLDVSGSMGNEISQVKSNMRSFITSLETSGINYRVGFITFADSYHIYNNSNFYTDETQILNIISNITLGENGLGNGGDAPENQLGAMAAASEFNFSPGAQKVIIMLTDASAHQNDAVTSWTVQQLINERLIPKGMVVFPIFDIKNSDQISQYVPIAESTSDGTYFYVFDNFNEIIDIISKTISGNYLVSYQSGNTLESTKEHTVIIEVSYNGKIARDTIKYTPGEAPKIARTEYTVELHNPDKKWGVGSSLKIEAYVDDNVPPYVQSVKLFFRTLGQTNYSSITMANSSKNIYNAVLPTAIVNSPGVEYYIQATDGIHTITDPLTDPVKNPYQIAIQSNMAPVIDLVPILRYDKGESVTIRAKITDITTKLAETYLYYRKQGQILYQQEKLIPEENDFYKAVIPASFIDNGVIEYYLRAKDDYGINSYAGWPDSPIKMDYAFSLPNISLNSSTVIFSGMMTVTVTGTRFTPLGEADLSVIGPSVISPLTKIEVNGKGDFTAYLYLNGAETIIKEGDYTLIGTDKTTGISSSFLFTITVPHSLSLLKLVEPAETATIQTGSIINVSWQNWYLLRDRYDFDIEYSIDNGTWQKIKNINGTINYFAGNESFNVQFKPLVTGRYLFRIVDKVNTGKILTSPAQTVISAVDQLIAVDFRWDDSYPYKPSADLVGVAADGVSRFFAVVSKRTPAVQDIKHVTVSLSDPDGPSSPQFLGKVLYCSKQGEITRDESQYLEANQASGTSATNLSSNTDGKYWFWYVAPDDFCRNTTDFPKTTRTILANFQIVFQNGQTTTVTKEIKIVRPPLMLVHGLLGDPSTWDLFPTADKNLLFIHDPRFLVKRAVTMNGKSAFDLNSSLLLGDTYLHNSFEGVINSIRNMGYASNQVDYVCHSMGGAMFRNTVSNFSTSYLRKINYYKGFAHKFISINTPHDGSTYANLLYDIDLGGSAFTQGLLDIAGGFYACNIWKGTCSLLDAIKDLRYLGGVKFSEANVRGHMIGSGMSCDEAPFWKSDLKIDLLQILYWDIWTTFGSDCEKLDKVFTQRGFEDYFIEDNDGIVSTVSQFSRNDILRLPSNCTRFDGLMHNSQVGNSPLQADVVGMKVEHLLNAETKSQLFGSLPSTLNTGVKSLSIKNQTPIALVEGKISILNPAPLTEIRPGENLTVNFRVDTVGLKSLGLFFQGQSIIIKPDAPDITVKMIVSSQNIEKQTLNIIGSYYDKGVKSVAAASVILNVVPIGTLTGLRINPNHLIIEKNLSIRPAYEAVYEKYIAQVGETDSIKVVIDNPAIAGYVPGTNRITGLSEGNTYATVTYRGKTATMAIQVVAFAQPPVDPPTGVNDIRSERGDLPDLKVYPNPFNDRITFEFLAIKDCRVQIDIFTVFGQKIKTVEFDRVDPGINRLEVDLTGFTDGIYMYRTTAGDAIRQGQIVKKQR